MVSLVGSSGANGGAPRRGVTVWARATVATPNTPTQASRAHIATRRCFGTYEVCSRCTVPFPSIFVANGALAAPGRAADAASAPRSEARVDAQPDHDCGVHVPESITGRIERPLDSLIDDLEVECRAEPGGERGGVIHLDRVLMAEAQTELLAQERDKVPTELRACPADPEVVRRAPRYDALAANPDVVGVLDGIRHAVGGAEPEEDADPLVGVALGAPEVLVEVIVD